MDKKAVVSNYGYPEFDAIAYANEPPDLLIQECYKALQKIQKGEDTGDTVIVGFELVTVENVGQYLE